MVYAVFRVPFDSFDFNAISGWLLNLSQQCIPEYDYLTDTPLSSSLDLFATNLMAAGSATLQALRAWASLLFHFGRLLIHILFVLVPSIVHFLRSLQPLIASGYRWWSSLDLAVQLGVLGVLSLLAVSWWIAKNRFIGRAHQFITERVNTATAWYDEQWRSLTLWVSKRSQIAAAVLPHFVWWAVLCLALWFAPNVLCNAHFTLSFVGCFVWPSVRTYAVIRKYTELAVPAAFRALDEKEQKQIRECIDPLSQWLYFWASRAAVQWVYFAAVYAISFVPELVTAALRPFLFEFAVMAVVSEWAILWLLAISAAPQWVVGRLSSSCFGFADDRQRGDRRREIAHRPLFSLSAANSLLLQILSVVRLAAPAVISEAIHDAVHQFAIFFVFFFVSPKTGALVLGYLLPIYCSIASLRNLRELRDKIDIWNSDRRRNLITPDASMLAADPQRESKQTPRASNRWAFWLKPLELFSFRGADDLTKNERKKRKMHHEADQVVSAMVQRLRYWIVFAAVECACFWIGRHFAHFVPFWDHLKFALILWLQLPFTPFWSTDVLYRWLMAPVAALDIAHILHRHDAVGATQKEEAAEEGTARAPGIERTQSNEVKAERKQLPAQRRRRKSESFLLSSSRKRERDGDPAADFLWRD